MTAQYTVQQQGPEAPIIPAWRNGVTMLCVHAFLATTAGLALRLLFVYRFPASVGDSQIYLQLAHNWADHHVYGLWLDGRLVPEALPHFQRHGVIARRDHVGAAAGAG